jgi:hypothetical protein
MVRKRPEFKGDRIPEFASEEEERKFWDNYSFGEAMEKGLLQPEEDPLELAPELAAKWKLSKESGPSRAKVVRLRPSCPGARPSCSPLPVLPLTGP